ncbi:MAG: hypothetical protein GX099_06345 [Clostridiaceae bacterium]|jgi:hypothetical protein|nr:hypothetical protein [Oscillospiraceae bacterium]NLO63029.1 hypothetical protein [Clostridiaceae bacterium]
MNHYEDVVRIEAEISGYRKACLRANIYLDRKLVAWNDSLQWNNNFLRSLSVECIDGMAEKLKGTDLLSWNTHYPELVSSETAAPVFSPEQWSVTVTFRDGTVFRSTGSRSFPAKWKEFRDLIECAVRVPFRLR